MKPALIIAFVLVLFGRTDGQGEMSSPGKTFDSLMQQETLRHARELFFAAGKEPCSADELLELTGNQDKAPAVLIAYRGAGSAIKADCLSMPFKKLQSFNRGRDLIEAAAELDPGNPEIRFIRFMVQDGAPGFLNYNHQEEDLDVWMGHFNQAVQYRDPFVRKMAEAICSAGFPEEDRKNEIRKLLDEKP